ncbi:unnamed protein product, partial [Rotaria magnacalcarata]
SGRQQR